MSPEVIATVLTGVGVLVGVWRLVEGVRRDLTAQIAAVNTRIDNILEINHCVDDFRPRNGGFPAGSYWPAFVSAGTLPCGFSAATPGPDGPRRVNQSVPSASRSSFGVCARSSGNGK